MRYGRPPKVTIFLDRQHRFAHGRLIIMFRVNFAQAEKNPATGKYITPKRVQFSTGFQCTEAQFDLKKRRMRNGPPSASTTNTYLDQLEAHTLHLWMEANRKGLDVYTVIRDEFVKGKPSLAANFMEHFQQFLESYAHLKLGKVDRRRKPVNQPQVSVNSSEIIEIPTTVKTAVDTRSKSRNTGQQNVNTEIFRARSEGTVRIYQTLYNDLTEFREKTKHPLLYIGLDHRFQNQFAAFLAERGVSTNSVQKKFEYLKSMLREFKKKGYPVGEAHEQWEKIANQTDPIEFALTQQELQRIMELNLDAKPKVKRIRDQFVFMALTGVRFSDALRISKDNLTEHNDRIVLSFRAQKTNAIVTIPFTENSLALNIFKQYDYRFGKISIMNFNLHLKSIAETIGLTDTYKEEKFVGNDRIIDVVRKCDTIGSHTARRTFATISFNKGVNIRFIQEMLGHKTIAQTESYIKSTLGFVDAGRIAAFDNAATGTEQGFAGV